MGTLCNRTPSGTHSAQNCLLSPRVGRRQETWWWMRLMLEGAELKEAQVFVRVDSIPESFKL